MHRQSLLENKRIGVIMGGSSSEREVSLKTGAAVADALTARGHDVVRFMLGESFGPEILTSLQRARLDVAFLALHGRLGEDGCIQGLLEIARIPYTGSGVLASALAMDKLKSKELFRLHNVPTPPYYMLESKDVADLEALHGSFGYPVMVKPRSEGSSVGVSKATDAHELSRAVALALEYDDVVLVERFVQGVEVDVGILDGRVLGAVEIAPKKGFYDYEAKYTPGMTDYHLPPRLPPARLSGVQNLALRAARALGVCGAVRVDLLVTPGENEYVLEVNTLPGMTQTSLLPKIAAAAGHDFTSLCEAIVSGARLHQPSRRKPTLRESRPAVPAIAELRTGRAPLLRAVGT